MGIEWIKINVVLHHIGPISYLDKIKPDSWVQPNILVQILSDGATYSHEGAHASGQVSVSAPIYHESVHFCVHREATHSGTPV